MAKVDIEITAMDVYDIEEVYPNCTVQVLRNSVTGQVSVGWWKNEPEEVRHDGLGT